MSNIKNQKGSTLLTTMILMLVVSVLIVSLHLTIVSMLNNLTNTTDEKQAYLTARSVATVIAEEMVLSIGTEDDGALGALANLEVAGDSLTISGVEFDKTDFNSGEEISGVIYKTSDGYLVTVSATYGEFIEEVSLSLIYETGDGEGLEIGMFLE